MQLGMQSQHKQKKKKATVQDNENLNTSKKALSKEQPDETLKEVVPKKVKPKKALPKEKTNETSKEIVSKKVKPKKKPDEAPKRKPKKSAKEAKDRLSDVVENKSKRTVDISDTAVIAAADTMTTQSLVSTLLTVILCITLSYLFVTIAADKLTMYWMGV